MKNRPSQPNTALLIVDVQVALELMSAEVQNKVLPNIKNAFDGRTRFGRLNLCAKRSKAYGEYTCLIPVEQIIHNSG